MVIYKFNKVIALGLIMFKEIVSFPNQKPMSNDAKRGQVNWLIKL